MQALTQAVKFTLVEAATTAGTTAIESASVDMNGFDAVAFLLTVGALTANAATSIKLQQSSDDGVADTYSDLAGTGITIADDDDGQTFYLDLIQPSKRYVRLVVSRATANAVVGEIYALQYHTRGSAGALPITNTVADTMTGEIHIAPSEGTA